MMSGIGSSPAGSRELGMALLEVLVAVTILSAGLVAVYRPLLASHTALHYAENRLEAHRVLVNRLWQNEEAAVRTGSRTPLNASETVAIGRKAFHYRSFAKEISQDRKLYEVEAEISWASGGITKKLGHSTYVYMQAPKRG